MSNYTKETIDQFRLDEIRRILSERGSVVTDALPIKTRFDDDVSVRCSNSSCRRRVFEGYEVKTLGLFCEDCAVLRLLNGLLDLIPPQTSAGPTLSEKIAADPDKYLVLKNYAAFADFLYESSEYFEHEPLMKLRSEGVLGTYFNQTVVVLPITEENFAERYAPAPIVEDPDPKKMCCGQAASRCNCVFPSQPQEDQGPEPEEGVLNTSKSLSGILEEVRGFMTHENSGNPDKPEVEKQTRGERWDLSGGAVVKAGDFSKTEGNVVHFDKDTKINVRDLPPGTVLRFDHLGRKNVGDKDAPDLERVKTGRVGEVVPKPVPFDLSTLPPDEQEIYRGYDQNQARPTCASEVFARERAAMNDPDMSEILAALEADDEDFFAEQRRLYGDEWVDTMIRKTSTGLVRGEDGIAKVSLKPKSTPGAVGGSPSSFPSLRNRDS